VGITALFLLLIFIVIMLMGIPIGFGMGALTLIGFVWLGGDLSLIPQKMFAGCDVYVYLCILLFILAADIMSIGGITYSIVRFCETLIGHIRGGLAHVNILASMLFAGLSGSAAADASGLGPIEIEMMTEGGYPRDFSCAVTSASAIIGPIIPPSNIMVIFAASAGTVSIGKMFAGGAIPGILLGLCYMAYCYYVAKKLDYPKRSHRATFGEIWSATKDTLPAIILPGLIFCFITFGIATPTETSCVAVIYAVIVSMAKKTFTIRGFCRSCIRAAKSTANVLFIIAASTAMGWLVTTMGVGEMMRSFFTTVVTSKWVFLLCTNIILLLMGTIIDASPALLLSVPILFPIALSYGVDPIHYGIIVCLNLMIGNITPPVGMMLFITSNVAKVELSVLYRRIIPFCFVAAAALLLVTYVPFFTTFIPGMMK
jgi:tripartite ATP-independent transporter DctM subunit